MSHAECTVEASVRLVGGNESTEGRVEYCRDNLWVSVCRDSWDHKDAQVVCRQLGFGQLLSCPYTLCRWYDYVFTNYFLSIVFTWSVLFTQLESL